MIKKIDTTQLLRAGISAESLRQNVIAGNIANIATPNYKSVGVKFEEALAKAIESGSDKGEDLDELKGELYTPGKTTVNSNGNDVDLDVEVSKMVKNTLRHKTYTLLLKKRYGQIRAAINTKA